jgi:hypothetical protein
LKVFFNKEKPWGRLWFFPRQRNAGKSPWFLGGITRPGKRLHHELENHHAIHGQIHYFDSAIFNSKLLVYQRVLGVE